MTKKRPCKKYSIAIVNLELSNDFFAKNIPKNPKIELRETPSNNPLVYLSDLRRVVRVSKHEHPQIEDNIIITALLHSSWPLPHRLQLSCNFRPPVDSPRRRHHRPSLIAIVASRHLPIFYLLLGVIPTICAILPYIQEVSNIHLGAASPMMQPLYLPLIETLQILSSDYAPVLSFYKITERSMKIDTRISS